MHCEYNDLVKEEVQRQIDIAIEDIPYDKSRLSTPIAKSRFQYKEISDFLLGFEYGHITGTCIWEEALFSYYMVTSYFLLHSVRRL
jgi:hypothetical protein